MEHNLWNHIFLTFSQLWKSQWRSQPAHYVVNLSVALEPPPLTHSSPTWHYRVSPVYQTGWWHRNNGNLFSLPNGLSWLKEGLLDSFLMYLCWRSCTCIYSKNIGQLRLKYWIIRIFFFLDWSWICHEMLQRRIHLILVWEHFLCALFSL